MAMTPHAVPMNGTNLTKVSDSAPPAKVPPELAIRLPTTDLPRFSV